MGYIATGAHSQSVLLCISKWFAHFGGDFQRGPSPLRKSLQDESQWDAHIRLKAGCGHGTSPRGILVLPTWYPCVVSYPGVSVLTVCLSQL